MTISVRASAEQERKYREFAASRGITVSEFLRKSADAAIAQAEEILRQADEERRHKAEVDDWKRRFNAYLDHLHSLPVKQYSDEELDAMRLERYA